LTDEEKHLFKAKIEPFIRWSTFMLHSVVNHQDLLRHVWGDRFDVNGREWDWGRVRILDRHRHLKFKTLSNVKEFVKAQMEADESLSEITSAAYLQIVIARFRSQDFLKCYNFMQEHLDFDGSSEAGKRYIIGESFTTHTSVYALIILSGTFANVCNSVREWRIAGEPEAGWRDIRANWSRVALDERNDKVLFTSFKQLSGNKHGQTKRKLADIADVFTPPKPKKVYTRSPHLVTQENFAEQELYFATDGFQGTPLIHLHDAGRYNSFRLRGRHSTISSRDDLHRASGLYGTTRGRILDDLVNADLGDGDYHFRSALGECE
jgi:hypothetical protein